MIKAVLFDLDGTLLDTLPDIHFHLNQTLKAFSYPEISLKETQRLVGDGARKLVERALPEGANNVDECYAHFHQIYANSDNSRTKLFEGEMACLQKLRENGLKLAVVTNKPQAAAEGCMRDFFAQFPFDCVAGDSGLFPVKPDATIARYVALSLRCAPCECAFVGDGEADAVTALNADMVGVAVLWGYREKAQLQAVGATRFVNSFEELTSFLLKK